MVHSTQRALVVGDTPDGAAASRLLRRDGWTVAHSTDADPREYDLLVVDEWTAETEPRVVAARHAGVRVTVLAELILTMTPRPVVAVTGTAGKTTTTRLLAAMLQAAGLEPLINPAGRAANAWPDHTLVNVAPSHGGWLVAELTSTHLCFMDVWPGPDVAVVTNVWPDHVELHGSVEAYVAAKRRLLGRSDGIAVMNADDHVGRTLLGRPASRHLVEFSLQGPVSRGAWLQNRRLRIRWNDVDTDVASFDPADTWMHPQAVVAAAAAALCCGAEPTAIADGLARASGLPHRFQAVGQVAGVRVIDDAMAATPAKALAAIGRCDPARLVLIVGGDREVGGLEVHRDPPAAAALDQALQRAGSCAHVVAFGTAAALVAAPIGRAVQVDTIAAAVAAAAERARPGDTILLAPMFPMAQADRATFAPAMLDVLATNRPHG